MTQRGFSLVELSISVVIIGLLMLGVFKGQSLIDQARIDAAIKTSGDLASAVGEFKNRYRLLPGDMPSPPVQGVIAGCSAGGNGNGQIDSTESACVPEVLSKAGLISVSGTAGGLPIITSHYGSISVISVTLSNVVTARGANPFSTTVQYVVELSNLPCEAAQNVDRKLDNDSFVDGSVAASVLSCTPSTSNDPVPFVAIRF
jgi:prepilin-type N-terminal cleavage/methylation domain-containing protein